MPGWPEEVKNMQTKWIGFSKGCLVKFPLKDIRAKVPSIDCFTTRPETLFGVTFICLSHNHPLVESVISLSTNLIVIVKYTRFSCLYI